MKEITKIIVAVCIAILVAVLFVFFTIRAIDENNDRLKSIGEEYSKEPQDAR